MKAMQQAIPGYTATNREQIQLTNSRGYDVEPAPTAETGKIRNLFYPPLPGYRMPGGECLIRWKLSLLDRLRIALSGNIWHIVATPDWSLQPFCLYAHCPVTQATPGKIKPNTEPHL